MLEVKAITSCGRAEVHEGPSWTNRGPECEPGNLKEIHKKNNKTNTTTLKIKSGLGPAGSSLSNDVKASLQEELWNKHIGFKIKGATTYDLQNNTTLSPTQEATWLQDVHWSMEADIVRRRPVGGPMKTIAYGFRTREKFMRIIARSQWYFRVPKPR